MSDTIVRPFVDNEFPEIEVAVAPITQRSRATLAKTHNRPYLDDFSALFGEK